MTVIPVFFHSCALSSIISSSCFEWLMQGLLKKPQALYAMVLSPTRELAIQIAEQFEALGSGVGVKCAVLVGGIDMMAQAIALGKRPHVIVGTPGRVVDHLSNTKVLSTFFNGTGYLSESLLCGMTLATSFKRAEGLHTSLHATCEFTAVYLHHREARLWTLVWMVAPMISDSAAACLQGFSLKLLKHLVLDEADRLLNMDFEQEIDQILKAIPKVINPAVILTCSPCSSTFCFQACEKEYLVHDVTAEKGGEK